MADVAFKKENKKEIDRIASYLVRKTSNMVEHLDDDICPSHLEQKQIQEPSSAEARSREEKAQKHEVHGRGNIDKRNISQKCEIGDYDILVSAIIKNKDIRPCPGPSKPKMKGYIQIKG
ncbi:hypothetical protein SAY87_002995 [Trapa incisa]|uniref:Uncharacterized protein n=1 Tax=Trapa incisa TaxID=236973 RepID=A0AAN7QHG8_9MYRT|nr:hypothetical protein SAY87_002995 [Trapa incisa]